MGFSRQQYWSELPVPSPQGFPDPGIEPRSPHCRQTLYNLSHQRIPLLLLLLLLSHFSRVRLCATPQTAAHQASPSLGFSRQEHWSGCHFPLQCMKVNSESEVAQLGPTLSNPMDCSPPGSSVHGIFQARVLEWGAIAFSVSSASLAFNFQDFFTF